MGALLAIGWPSQGLAQRRIERVTKDEKAKSSGGNRWAVIVGVDQYQAKDIEPLSGAVADAKAIRDVLTKYAEFPDAQVTLLVSDGTVKPTAGTIMDTLDGIKKSAKAEDLLLFFFAGHGVQVDGQRYLLTYEANISSTGRLKTTSLAASALMQELEAIRVAHRVIMVDACRNDPTKPGHKPNLADEAFENAFTLQPTSEGGVRATFLSSSNGQSAYEWTEKHRGFFSFFIEKGLSGEAAQYGKVTVTSLLTYLNEMVPQKVREQKNQLQVPYAKVDGSELILVKGDKLPAQTATLDKQPAVAATRTIYGVVKDSSGAPLPGATIRVALATVSRAVGGKPSSSPPELTLTTDEDGFFKADGVAPDVDVKVTASKSSYLPKTLTSPPAEAGRKLVVFLPRTEAAPVRVAVADTPPTPLPSKATSIPAQSTPPPPTPLPPATPAPSKATSIPAQSTPPPPTPLPPATPAPSKATSVPTRTPPPPAPTTVPPPPPSPSPAAKRTPLPGPTPTPVAQRSPTPAPPTVPSPSPQPTPPPQSKGSELAMVAYRTFLAEDFKEAENSALLALQVEPDNPLANAVLGNATLALGVNTGDAQKTASAREFIDKALRRDPQLALAHNAKGLAFMAEGKFNEALPQLQEAIQGDPRLVPARANLAYVLEKQTRFDDSEREYREAIRLAPESAVPYNGLSALLFSRGKYKDAVKASREAISRYQLRDRFLGLLYVQLAIAQFQQGHQNEAVEAVGRAKALGVQQHDAYNVIEKGKPAKKKG